MEKLITLFLTLLVIPLSVSANQEVDLTLPETPFDFEQIQKDALKIQAYKESQKIEFIIDKPRPDIYEFVAWNVADVYLTNKAIKTNVGREMNPIHPDYPHLDRLIFHKVLASYLFDRMNYFEDKELVEITNKVGWLVVLNNAYVLYD